MELFNREEPPGIYAESWEASDRSDGMSVITNGSLAGMSLHDVVENHSKALFGEEKAFDRFPLLLKLIDAQDNLSIQVHPDDQKAEMVSGEAKTEAWIILDALEDTVVYAGFNQLYPQEMIDQKLSTRDIIAMMHTLPVEKGDVIFIPGGRLHAIGKGCLILEIQQNSNTTYRVYDWDRPRPLHLDKARQVIHYTDTHDPRKTPTLLEESSPCKQWNLLNTSHFSIEKWLVQSSMPWPSTPDHFDLLFCLSGKGQLTWDQHSHPIEKGMTCLIPAETPPILVEVDDDLELFRFYTA